MGRVHCLSKFTVINISTPTYNEIQLTTEQITKDNQIYYMFIRFTVVLDCILILLLHEYVCLGLQTTY